MLEPIKCTIPQIVQKCANINEIATVFDSENEKLTFSKIFNEMNVLAAGLLASGLQMNDKVLICGSNCAQLFLSALACARARLIFSLLNPNFSDAKQLQHALNMGEFRAIICFSANKENELLYNYLCETAPEIRSSAKGHVSSKAIPKLTHIIMAEEEHKHAGTFTLSEIYGRSNREKMEKMHPISDDNPDQLAVVQFTTGVTGQPKFVGLTHYQLLNGCLSSVKALNIKKDDIVCCALPMFKIPIFTLVGLLPFVLGTQVIFPSPSPLPRFLFNSINSYKCTHLLTNAIALRIILKILSAKNVELLSLNSIILAGERVPSEVINNITSQLKNVTNIVSTYLLTEVASMPIMTNNRADIINCIGKAISGFQINIAKDAVPVSSYKNSIGELQIRPVFNSRFFGYGPKFSDGNVEWINTGDVVKLNESGNICLIGNKDDLIFSSNGTLVEYWIIERTLCLCDLIKGAQVIKCSKNSPLTAIVVPKANSVDKFQIKSQLQSLCKNNKLEVPEKFGFVNELPRISTKIQKYRLREMIQTGNLELI
uniref:AMP-binding domain-containing protein n=1 Tax=Syphacia muris TaxID=451379 RepID=A0A0N5ASW6_9BILA